MLEIATGNRNDLGFQSAAAHPPGIIGQSKQLHEVLARVEKAAPADANVCISGVSGTGHPHR